ncbi:hypothetical protein [Myroides phaeus]|nr:hypothetical protein [Myroides phaeus]
MKKRFFYGLITSASIAATISACSSSDNNPVDPINFDGRIEAQLPREFK